jgi:hypothetical protein
MHQRSAGGILLAGGEGAGGGTPRYLIEVIGDDSNRVVLGQHETET